MMDFLITQSGDLAFQETNVENNKLTISFYKTKTKALKINFEFEANQFFSPKENSLLINFDLINIKDNKKAMMVSGNEFLAQQVAIRLKTSLGEISQRPEIGSIIETVMHKNINDKAVLNKVERIVMNAISGIMSGIKVKATPKIKKEDDDYRQVINVIIYKDEDIIINYELEG